MPPVLALVASGLGLGSICRAACLQLKAENATSATLPIWINQLFAVIAFWILFNSDPASSSSLGVCFSQSCQPRY